MIAMRTAAIVFLSALLFASAAVDAAECIKNQDGDVVCGKGQCAIDQYGKVFCAKAGGGAIRDQYGNVQCGIGYCAKNDTGDVHCSRTPGGGAEIDSYGNVKCAGGCQRGTQQRCQVARPGSG